jgi:hypothetical protein
MPRRPRGTLAPCCRAAATGTPPHNPRRGAVYISPMIIVLGTGALDAGQPRCQNERPSEALRK